MIEYLIRWAETQLVKDYTGATSAKLLFEYLLTRFGFPKVLIRDSSMHFLNETINTLTEEFQWNDWDVHVPVVLWAYKTTCKKLSGQTPFRLVYGIEAVMPMEYIMPSLQIATFTGMANHESLEEWLAQLMELEEYIFLVRFHQQVEKESEKSWHDQHIKV
eukprot:PITA_22855